MAKAIELKFDGYWREINSGGIPNSSGIYLVYCCKYNTAEKTVAIRKLIYIGESSKVNERISGHEKKTECWNGKLQSGEVLCYSFASVSNPDREIAEAALIFKHKPVCNTEYMDDFLYEQTTVKSSGMCNFIESSFIVTA
ncbi:GIY-YIG nuclease family protein [Nitrosarchaeum sp. AC2]|uniref:GIY-YIG nuclease family protein n=1 Tax=Nitrosarchaeum sp. AC2 TaxID=2259673 RepID=UPI0015CEDF1C|nr:GIY-YIG nuclease family protein [Nitrosarchaeum sp. AC2]QLH11253.1 GIY-YIG nuclease family protein [Nitrosarchaeum sp. AC2]